MGKVKLLPLKAQIKDDLFLEPQELRQLGENIAYHAILAAMEFEPAIVEQAEEVFNELMQSLSGRYSLGAIVWGCLSVASCIMANLLVERGDYEPYPAGEGVRLARRVAVRTGHQDEDGHHHLRAGLGGDVGGGDFADSPGKNSVFLGGDFHELD